MKLRDLLQDLTIQAANVDLDLDVTGISYDSRTTQPGDLFVAMVGYETDGHKYIPMALEKGAACVLCQKPQEDGVPHIQVENARLGLALASRRWFQCPADQMKMVAVTGTNGKTSTTYLLKHVLEKQGAKVGLIGTNQNMIGEQVIHTERTTPESFELQKLFREMADAGCTHVVMEVSSHALYLDRVAGVFFETGIFTNLTQDHLDFHKTMEAYCNAKAILFRHCRFGLVNADDPWAERIMKDGTCAFTTFGIRSGDLRAEDIRLSETGIAFTLSEKGEKTRIEVAIPGEFMVYNTLGVFAAARALGISREDIAAALREVEHVRGRVEPVPTDGDYTILLDYAHTPDALENVLKAVRGFAKGRVVVLFGCGGDRDRTKRPKMGAIAGALADVVIVTSDNPRTEDPAAIIQEILPGLEGCSAEVAVVENRVEAIHWAIDHAQAGDVIVLAGKGHEDYQVIGHEKHHLDEREVVADYLAQRRQR